MTLSSLTGALPSGPETPAGPTAKLIDFAKTPLARCYSSPPRYALIIDDLFTKLECENLLYLAEVGDTWQEALINSGGNQQVYRKDVRNCTRIMLDDPDTANWIFERVKPYVEDVVEIGVGTKWGHITGHMGHCRWKMSRLNERLRFLRYTKDQYFKPHCDGSYVTPGDEERSFLTLHLYLNSSGSNDLTGGATRFFGSSFSSYLDVDAKQGRVLIFQHSSLVHSGEEVVSGVKYTMRTDIMFKRG